MLFTITFAYQDKEYTYKHEFADPNDPDWTTEQLAEYMYVGGNYSCDCSRSDLIREYCDETFPEMECGEKIELVSLSPRPIRSNPVVYTLHPNGLYLGSMYLPQEEA